MTTNAHGRSLATALWGSALRERPNYEQSKEHPTKRGSGIWADTMGDAKTTIVVG
jgi:hypothetical protein